MTLDKLLVDMENIISAAQLVGNTAHEAVQIRAELCEDMRALIRMAYRAGREEAMESMVAVQEKML